VGARVHVDGQQAVIVEAKRAGGRPVVRLDRDVARGELLEVPAAELPPPAEGSFYVFQLIGLDVEEEGGRELGRVQEVAPGVANDVLELDSGIDLPMVEECIRAVDIERGRIVVSPGFVEPR
jgi:16S rRNA processing protein RimM